MGRRALYLFFELFPTLLINQKTSAEWCWQPRQCQAGGRFVMSQKRAYPRVVRLDRDSLFQRLRKYRGIGCDSTPSTMWVLEPPSIQIFSQKIVFPSFLGELLAILVSMLENCLAAWRKGDVLPGPYARSFIPMGCSLVPGWGKDLHRGWINVAGAALSPSSRQHD